MVNPESYSHSNRAVPDPVVLTLLLCACLFEVVLGTMLARTHLPLCDEGFYGVPAHILSTTGSLRNPIMESAGIKYLRGVDRHFYWMAPMGMVLQALAFVVFGFSLLIQRELSVLCGLGAVLCWYLTLKRLLSPRVAALSVLFLSVDFVFLSLCSLGRSDMISLFFGSVALAGYLTVRERSLSWALAVASGASALSGMTHPNAGIAAVISLAILVFVFDRTRLRWSHLAIVAACYGVFGLAWISYIAKAPDLFAAQFLGNVANRFAHHRTLTDLFVGEFARYISAYGLEGAHGLKAALYVLPAVYVSAFVLCLLFKDIRAQQGTRILLLMFVGISSSLIFLEGSKQGWYLVHLSPLFASFLAISVNRLWQSERLLPRLATALQISIVLFGVARLCFTARQKHLQQLYQPTVVYLNDHLRSSNVVFARSEFYFGLHCRSCLRDDPNLGIFSGRRADFIVMDQDYRAHLASLLQANGALYDDVRRILETEYREVFKNENYQIFQRSEE
jgi:hypothetical protein